MDLNNKHIWLMGASEGIGRALAQELDKRGAHVALSARSEERLASLRDELSENNHLVLPADVTDQGTLTESFAAIDKAWNACDVAIFNVGYYEPMHARDMKLEDCLRTIDINLRSIYNWLDIIVPYFRARKRGRIVIVGSVAGYRGLPGSLAYGPTKAALINLCEALYAELADDGIEVQMVSPGFVKTRLTDKNDFSMPMRISAEKAGALFADGLESDRFEIHFPKLFTYSMKLLRALPTWAYLPLAKRIS